MPVRDNTNTYFNSMGESLRRHPVRLVIAIVVIAAVLLLDVLIDAPFRRWLESAANDRLKGYSVRIPEADLRPWNLMYRVNGLRIYQDANAGEPVFALDEGTLSISWLALFRGAIVADLDLQQPVISIDTRRLAAEDRDEVDFTDRGWQRLWELYPLKVNKMTVRNGVVSYTDAPSKRTLRLSDLKLDAGNIRHVAAEEKRYPSPFAMTATVFDNGTLTLDGHADLLLRPHAGLNAVLVIDDVSLDALGPIVDDYRLQLKGGMLAAKGQIEVRPENYIANMQFVRIDGLKADVVAGDSDAATRAAQERLAKAADATENSSAIRLRMQSLRVTGQLGYVSATQPEYRAFLSDANISISNLSNRAAQGESQVTVGGAFMGSGATAIRGVWRPGKDNADFALDVRIENTKLEDMNPLLRAYGNLDASQGQFSLYSQLYATKGRLSGYVKPLFQDVELLGKSDENDNPFKKLYEFVVEKVAHILENRQRDEVATVTDISGDISNPDISGWEVFGNLLKNAFIDAILPGFERARGADKK